MLLHSQTIATMASMRFAPTQFEKYRAWRPRFVVAHRRRAGMGPGARRSHVTNRA